MGLAVDKTSEV